MRIVPYRPCGFKRVREKSKEAALTRGRLTFFAPAVGRELIIRNKYASESVAGRKTARVRRPVLILGSLDGIETGIRQLRSPDLSPKGHATFPPKVTLPFAQRSRYLSLKGHATFPPKVTPDRSVPLCEFPHVFGTYVNLIRPYKRPIPYKHLIEESLVLKAAPVGLVKVSRTVENGPVAGVEHDIDLVAVLRFRGHYVMDDPSHRFAQSACLSRLLPPQALVRYLSCLRWCQGRRHRSTAMLHFLLLSVAISAFADS